MMRLSKIVFSLFGILLFLNTSAQVLNVDSIKFKEKFVFTNYIKLKDTNISVENLTGKFVPSKNPNFIEADTEYAKYPLIYIREEVYIAFIKMFYAALNDTINLKIVSCFRNFDTQRFIWENKWRGEKKVNEKVYASNIKDPTERAKLILTSSSMPGTSRHHWGTDIDINSVEVKYWDTKDGRKVYAWLKKNAIRFGFCQPYCSSDFNTCLGYDDELWHWSFIPLSQIYMRQYGCKVKYSDIKGFSGSETAPKLKIIENYILNINMDCYFKVKY